MQDEELYELVVNEIQDGYYEDELWQKALDDNDGNLEFAREEYIELRVAQIKNQGIGAAAEEIPQKDEFQPSREPVKKRNIFIGIFIVVLLIVLIIVLGFLLHGYFN